MGRKTAIIDSDFESTIRMQYPFAKSLYNATKQLNQELKFILSRTNEIQKKR